jgi:hypothetical protein
MGHLLKRLGTRFFVWLAAPALLLLFLLAACSTPAPEVVEVTRIVTETVIEEVERETVEAVVTRVVTETVIETITIEENEGETGEAPPSATGSEGDSDPLPPAPGDGPKVTSRVGTSSLQDIALVTAVPLRTKRSNPTNTNTDQPTILEFIGITDPIEWQKWCGYTGTHYKKRCQ